MLVSYLVRTSSHGHPLEEIAYERMGVQPRTAREAGFEKGYEPPPGDPRLAAFAAERIDLVRRLAPVLRGELREGRLAEVYATIEAPLVPVLLGMEETGIALSPARVRIFDVDTVEGGKVNLIYGIHDGILELEGKDFLPQEGEILEVMTSKVPVTTAFDSHTRMIARYFA